MRHAGWAQTFPSCLACRRSCPPGNDSQIADGGAAADGTRGHPAGCGGWRDRQGKRRSPSGESQHGGSVRSKVSGFWSGGGAGRAAEVWQAPTGFRRCHCLDAKSGLPEAEGSGLCPGTVDLPVVDCPCAPPGNRSGLCGVVTPEPLQTPQGSGARRTQTA